MKTVQFGNRTEQPAWFDMACEFKKKSNTWYGKGFRIGDLAAAYIHLGEWRRKNPNRKLTIYVNSYLRDCEYSRHLNAPRLFESIADIMHIAGAQRGLYIPPPIGQRLYWRSLWKDWAGYRAHGLGFKPEFKPLHTHKYAAESFRNNAGVPGFYVTCQPLFDALYCKHRNLPIAWWQAVVDGLVEAGLPVVILGDSKQLISYHNSEAFDARRDHIHAGVSLALINEAFVHIGGETGTTLWAPILKVPTVAVYQKGRHPEPDGKDSRPISFGAPVEMLPLGCPAQHVVESTMKLIEGKR